MGAVDAPVVISTFFSFAPAFVHRAVPAVWELITPAHALRAREAGAVAAATDAAAARPWARLGPGRTAELAELLAPVARACATALPYPNPVGVPAPAAG